MEWYPSLFLKFFRQLIFPCRHMCSLETLGTIPTSRHVFVENVFTSLILYESWLLGVFRIYRFIYNIYRAIKMAALEGILF